MEYVKHITFLNDVKIIIATVMKVLKRSDIQVGSEFKAGKFIDQRKERMNRGEINGSNNKCS